MQDDKKLELVRRQRIRGHDHFLILTDPDPKTGAARAITVDVQAGAIERVKNTAMLLRSAAWQPLTPADPDLDALVCRVPALRRHRGIEVRLPSGLTAWILWRQWSSADPETQARLSGLTRNTPVPAYEPDGDHFLASHAAEALGAQVLDPPRTAPHPGGTAY